MNRMLFVILCVTAALCFPGVSSSVDEFEGTLSVPMGIIELKPPEGVIPVNSLVQFPHARHFIYDCRRCHHKWEGDTQNLSCGTSNCHDLSGIPKAESMKQKQDIPVRYFKNAYHDQCIGCHKSIKANNSELELSKKMLKSKLPKPGPTGCVECHPRQK
jgi:hypothetical protein